MPTKTVTVNNQQYRIEMQRGRMFAQISGLIYVTPVYSALGIQAPILFKLEQDEIRAVVVALGWNFSKSKIWRNTWEHYARGK